HRELFSLVGNRPPVVASSVLIRAWRVERYDSRVAWAYVSRLRGRCRSRLRGRCRIECSNRLVYFGWNIFLLIICSSLRERPRIDFDSRFGFPRQYEGIVVMLPT
ncbi:unnamed protein product, partial [Hapterophycus canaliculatus]